MFLNSEPLPYVELIPLQGGMAARYIAWTPPYEDSWKLNFAGCAGTKSTKKGAGYILRNENAIFKTACAFSVDCSTSIEAELEAMKFGLGKAIKEGVDYLEIEGNSATAMQLVLGHIKPYSQSIRKLVNKCNFYLQNFRTIRFHHVSSFANRVATKVAEMGVYGQEAKHWHENPPRAVLQILNEDVLGHYIR